MKKLLFVDTNIWLDFYRARTEAGVGLLDHLDTIQDKLIITYQVEMEFKKHRQAAILEGFKALKGPDAVPRLGLFSDAKSTRSLQRDIANAERRVNDLKDRLRRALAKPASHDPVYQVFQRCYHKSDHLALTRDSEEKTLMRRKAFKRFLHGCPPRKQSDTSIGDAINWEWIVHCADKHGAEIHIASRDSDYGVTFENRSYVNDHLLQEFRERVSKKRGLFLHTRLSEALKQFSIKVTPEEEKEEEAILTQRDAPVWSESRGALEDLLKSLGLPEDKQPTAPTPHILEAPVEKRLQGDDISGVVESPKVAPQPRAKNIEEEKE